MLQNEVLVATEAAKSSQRADLENHIKTAQNTLEEKNNELAKMKSLLEQVGHVPLNMINPPILNCKSECQY